ncbi:multiubiquitin domain-containing protein [Devosia sp. PTR5]|uniref:Multiubiquitin domain-containing protein n=1 Tax=Devosia oryzisoli TaxID=2774138 RepID=A0A927FU46_9HYPH|nr:multiubiquitin domain-containing protein [Devosia oryzisoli]MBD8066041.1 multiubiquitin domain-containing protein [Devosia oryzisoli]
MTSNENTVALGRGNRTVTVEIARTDLAFHPVEIDTATPTGGKIAKVAGFNSDQHPHVMQWLPDGDLEDIRVQEEADLSKSIKFIVAENSSSHRITINDETLDWPADVISGAVVRKLGKIDPADDIYLERDDEPDLLVRDQDLIKIKAEGVEEFKSRKPDVWKLNVQGKVIVSKSSTISAADAMAEANFDPNAWIMILKVQGQPKRQLQPSDVIDLTTPGIEKIRLTAKDVNNGEAPPAPRRDFALQSVDEQYLDALGFRWETDATGRWLIIHDYPVSPGYTVTKVTLAIQVLPTYPQTQIDMFYVYPALVRRTGGAIPATQTTATIRGLSFQRWSRHRGAGSKWNPKTDNVITHLAIVESAIAKEVGQ